MTRWVKLINLLKSDDLLPAVVFSFSKKRCVECAFGLTGLDLTTSGEKSAIHLLFQEAVSRCALLDAHLPCVQCMLCACNVGGCDTLTHIARLYVSVSMRMPACVCLRLHAPVSGCTARIVSCRR